MTRPLDWLALLGASVLGCGGAPTDVRSSDDAPPPSEPDTRLADDSASGGETSAEDHDVLSPQAEPEPPGSTAPAAHGEVCSSADGSRSRPCAAGLSCCYPCGIEGCDSVCHTAEECRMDRMRP